ncbi:hypothetical protein [Cupriavidus necator]
MEIQIIIIYDVAFDVFVVFNVFLAGAAPLRPQLKPPEGAQP